MLISLSFGFPGRRNYKPYDTTILIKSVNNQEFSIYKIHRRIQYTDRYSYIQYKNKVCLSKHIYVLHYTSTF